MFRTAVVLVTLGLVAAGCEDDATDPDTGPIGEESICDADNGGLTLPAGFCAVVVHDATIGGEPARARHIAVAANGDVFVALDSEGGGVLALRDTDGDGKADETARFGTTRGHGIAIQGSFLYFATRGQVERYTLSAESLEPVSGPEVIVTGMPEDGDHFTKSIVVTDDGTLFVNLGSASDVCQEENREPGSPGVDPCPELPIRSGIWRYDANQTGQVHSPAARFATGTRNVVALALNPIDGELYGVQHGRDNLNEYWPQLFTPQDQAELPSEEFFRLEEGAEYGWPYCYYDGRQNLKVLAPEYDGDGTVQGRCDAMELPLHTFAAHTAPNGLLFYTGAMFPARYQGGAFVAFHGGFNRPDPFTDVGFNVVFVPFSGGDPTGSDEVFADGFVGAGQDLPGDAEHRPVGLAQGPDGSLYVTDDAGGRIWRILVEEGP